MITLQNTTKSVKVLNAKGMPKLRVIPGFNRVDIDEKELNKYAKSNVNKAMIKESIKLIDVTLSDENEAEALAALELNKKLNKAQRVIAKQNERILEKDESNTVKAGVIKEQGETIEAQAVLLKEQGELMAKMQKQLDKIDKKAK